MSICLWKKGPQEDVFPWHDEYEQNVRLKVNVVTGRDSIRGDEEGLT